MDPKITLGCAENGKSLTRRGFLGVSAALFSSAVLPSMASAQTNPSARMLVVVLRGGMDGMNLLIPSFDADYERVRRNLAIPREAALDLAQGFQLHPAMPRLHACFEEGQASFVPTAAVPNRSKSHFETQESLENGLPANTSSATGWINRFMGILPAGDRIRLGRSLGIGESPLIIRGNEPVLGWSNTWFGRASPSVLTATRNMYRDADPSLFDALQRGVEADRLAGGQAHQEIDRGPLINGFSGAARLLSLNEGPRVAVISVDGWDTHQEQGTLTGVFPDRLALLDEAIHTFRQGMGSAWENTVVLVVTEFGRTVEVNGTRGTDHGIAMPVILVGGALRGGIYGDWPGLSRRNLLNGIDLYPSVDIRAVFKGVLRDHFGAPIDRLNSVVFPGSLSAGTMNNLIRTRPAARARRQAAAAVAQAAEYARSPIEGYRAANGM